MSVNDYLRITNGANIRSTPGSNPVILQLMPQGLYGVITTDGTILVPFGKYDYIDDNFNHGIARVKRGKGSNGVLSSNCKWGIIDTNGNELIPVIYDNAWQDKNKPNILYLESEGEKTEQAIPVLSNMNSQ